MRRPRGQEWQRWQKERGGGRGRGRGWYASEETAKQAGRAAEQTMLGLSVHLGKGLDGRFIVALPSETEWRDPCSPLALATTEPYRPTSMSMHASMGAKLGSAAAGNAPDATPHAGPSPQSRAAAVQNDRRRLV